MDTKLVQNTTNGTGQNETIHRRGQQSPNLRTCKHRNVSGPSNVSSWAIVLYSQLSHGGAARRGEARAKSSAKQGPALRCEWPTLRL